AFETVRLADPCWGHADVVCDGLHGVAAMNFVARDTTGVGDDVFAGGVLAGGDGNDQLAVSGEILAGEVIGFGDGFGRGAIRTGDGGHRVSGLNFVIAPPHTHIRGNGG